MPLAGATYSAVSWTVGDVLTEAKLDAMVSNDRAYDSHAPNGILLNNNIGYFQIDTGGTNRELLNLTSGDVVNVGNELYARHEFGKNNGWNKIGDTWTYASANSINVPSGAANFYSVGDSIAYTQGTVKYAKITSVADTLLGITGGDDYVVANSAISNIYVAKGNASGFPAEFAYTPAEVGWSSMTVQKGWFSIHGRMVFLRLNMSGTSNATTATAGLPYSAASGTDLRWDGINGYIANNGVDITVATRWAITSGGSVVSFYTDMNNGAWANANEKTIVALISYRI